MQTLHAFGYRRYESKDLVPKAYLRGVSFRKRPPGAEGVVASVFSAVSLSGRPGNRVHGNSLMPCGVIVLGIVHLQQQLHCCGCWYTRISAFARRVLIS